MNVSVHRKKFRYKCQLIHQAHTSQILNKSTSVVKCALTLKFKHSVRVRHHPTMCTLKWVCYEQDL